MKLSDKIDQLLSKISQEAEYSQESSYNFDTQNESIEYHRILTILCNEKLIAKTFTNSATFHITSLGTKVLVCGGWNSYQEIEKAKEDRIEKKANLDLKISEFQVKTKWVPYWVSFLSLIISIFAYFKDDNKPVFQNKSQIETPKAPKTDNPKKIVKSEKQQ
jgi:hypothetical protein